VKRTNYEAPHYAIFSSLTPLPDIHISNLFSDTIQSVLFKMIKGKDEVPVLN
jgi:hypothetical protein